MHRLAEQHAPAVFRAQLFRTARPVQEIRVIEGLDHADPADIAAVDQRPRLRDRRVETVARPNDQGDAGPLAGLDHGLAIGQGNGERFLDQHILAGRRGGHDLFGMQPVRRCDIDRFQAGMGQQTVEIGVAAAT